MYRPPAEATTTEDAPRHLPRRNSQILMSSRWPWRILCPCNGRGGFYAHAEIQVRTDRTHGLKCLLCMIQTDAERRGNREKMPPPPKRPRTWCENTECVVQNPKFAFRNKAKGDYQPRWKVCRLEEKRIRSINHSKGTTPAECLMHLPATPTLPPSLDSWQWPALYDLQRRTYRV